jgi:TRAP-type uncharacterized transport system fused permease subunit
VGIAAVAAGVQKFALRPCGTIERWLLIAAGLALVFPSLIADVVAIVTIVAILGWQWRRRTTPTTG